MRGPLAASLVCGISLALGLMAPPLLAPLLAWLSGAALSLVVLRLGVMPGLQVAAFSLIPAMLVVVMVFGAAPQGALLLATLFWLPVLLLSLLLRQSASLSKTFAASAAMTVAGVACTYLLIPDPAAYWAEGILAIMQPGEFPPEAQINAAEFRALVQGISTFMTGMVASVVMLGTLVSLMLARYWQALLYNPGGFGESFRGLTFGKPVAALATLVGVAAMLLKLPVLVNVAPALVMLFMFQGLAVMHWLVRERNMNAYWLTGIYVLLIFLFLHTMVLLGALGIVDNWLNLRRKGNE
ncbi:hypothetical protein Q4485_11920 [Granulosicoccaceae sp. 1_MG-2023]|nr:hypothetical protein [Granulosicoccaceae sp. 1_MG-2023]